MGYTGDGDDDDNNWEAIVGQVMRGLAIHSVYYTPSDWPLVIRIRIKDQDLRFR